jgi:Cu(I)/Ag(I) efflux system membrane fusion protein
MSMNNTHLMPIIPRLVCILALVGGTVLAGTVAAAQDTAAGAMQSMDHNADTKGKSEHGQQPAGVPAAPGRNMLVVDVQRLQSIGVKFEEAKRKEVTKTIRTVGQVAPDERLVADVNIKIEGWIDRLLVNTTGEQVKKGQILFTLYSPELVATQQEYLLALQAVQRLGDSQFKDVAEGARSTLDVARRRLQLWDIEDYHITDLERTGAVLKTLPIHAPLSGTVTEKKAVAGMHVEPGDSLYTITDLTRVWVMADIYEYELPLIAKGLPVSVSLAYAPQQAFSGTIGFIYPTIDEQTRTARIRVELDNRAELLKPGMYANVELSIPLGNRLVVPKDAVLESGERRIVFIHHMDGRLEWRPATVGVRSGDWVEILEGLAEGEHIVTTANFLLDSESQLKAAVGGMQGMKH